MTNRPKNTSPGVQKIALSERTATRLLERYLAWQGGAVVAQQTVAAAEGLKQRYVEGVGEVVDVPEGATINVDFKNRVLTITPAQQGAQAPEKPPGLPEPAPAGKKAPQTTARKGKGHLREVTPQEEAPRAEVAG